MAKLIIVHRNSDQKEEIMLNADMIVSADSTTKAGGNYTSVTLVTGQPAVQIIESLGQLATLAK